MDRLPPKELIVVKGRHLTYTESHRDLTYRSRVKSQVPKSPTTMYMSLTLDDMVSPGEGGKFDGNIIK